MKKYTIFWLAALLPLCMFSCLKETNDTIILMGKESYFQNLQDVIQDSSLQTFCTNNGVVLAEGVTPPDIQGEFKFANRWIKASYTGLYPAPQNPNDTLFFRFGGEKAENGEYLTDAGQNNVVVACDFQERGLPLISYDTVYVMGHDNVFSVYFKMTQNGLQSSGVTFNLTQGVIITGTMGQETLIQGADTIHHPLITNTSVIYRNENVEIIHNDGFVPDDAIYDMVGWKYLYKSTSGSAEYYEWFGK